MGELLHEPLLIGPDGSENPDLADDFEESVLNTLDQIPVTPINLPEDLSGESEIDWPASYHVAVSQPPPDYYQQPLPSESRHPPVYDGVWSVDPDTVAMDPFESSR